MTFDRFEPRSFDWGVPEPQAVSAAPLGADPRLQEAFAAIDALDCRQPPKALTDVRWHELLKDLHHVADHWLDLALTCGWSLIDLFGSPPLFAGRVDLMGAAILLRGRPIESVDSNRIMIGNRLGPPNVFYRHAPGVSVPFERVGSELIWDVLAKVEMR